MRYTDRIYNIEHTANQAYAALSKELGEVLFKEFSVVCPEVTDCTVTLEHNTISVWLGKNQVTYDLTGIYFDHRYLKVRRRSNLPNASTKLNSLFRQIIFDVLTKDTKGGQ